MDEQTFVYHNMSNLCFIIIRNFYLLETEFASLSVSVTSSYIPGINQKTITNSCKFIIYFKKSLNPVYIFGLMTYASKCTHPYKLPNDEPLFSF